MHKSRIDWTRFTHGATDNYGDIDSIERIKLPDERFRKESRFPQGYPGQFTPNWWALRKRYETLLARGRRELFAGPAPKVEPEAIELSDVAKCASLGVESADNEYAAIDPATGMHVHLSSALRTMRDTDPERFAAVVAETRRMNSLGRRRIAPAEALKRMP